MTDTDSTQAVDDSEPNRTLGRRAVLTTAVGIGGLGLFGAGRASAQVTATPSGDVGTESNPYLHAYVNRQVFVARTSDPTPPNGTMWYRSDL